MTNKTNKTIPQPSSNIVMQRLLQIPAWIGTTTSLVVHTLLFIAALSMPFWTRIKWEEINLALTTAVSLEAIYLSLFIQISVNQSNASIAEIQEDVEEIQEDVEGIQEDVEEIQEEIQEDENKENKEDKENVEKATLPISIPIPTALSSRPKSGAEVTNEQILRELKSLRTELNRLKKT
jgi:low affinity Fe/Cu permease